MLARTGGEYKAARGAEASALLEGISHVEEAESEEVPVRCVESAYSVLAQERREMRVGNKVPTDGNGARYLLVHGPESFLFRQHASVRSVE